MKEGDLVCRKWHIGGFPMSIGYKVGPYLTEELKPDYFPNHSVTQYTRDGYGAALPCS